MIKTYNEEHGYGFIIPEGFKPREADKFFHISECAPGFEPQPGVTVTYEDGTGRNDKPCAVKVQAAP